MSIPRRRQHNVMDAGHRNESAEIAMSEGPKQSDRADAHGR